MKRLFRIGIRPSSGARLCRISHPTAGLEKREDVKLRAAHEEPDGEENDVGRKCPGVERRDERQRLE